MAQNKNEPAQAGAFCPRLGRVGGQAVLEGVMMKAGEHTVTTCRKENGELVVTDDSFRSVRKKHKILDLPLLRGIVNFVEMMILSVKTLNASADALGIEEEETRFEKWLKKHFGVGIVDVVMVIGVILGFALAIGLFMILPAFLVNTVLFKWIFSLDGSGYAIWRSILEGLIKVVIFLIYLWGVALMPDIRRVFQYHGAEHKSIACFEAGEELTPANAMRFTRFHPRCGTSFMFFMILLGIVVGIFVHLLIPDASLNWLYIIIRFLLLPLVVGIGYEFIMYAGKHDNFFTRTLSAPGLWVQRLTTKEPEEPMLECAITSLKCAMRDEIPEFMDFYNARPWEVKPEAPAEDIQAEATEDETPAENPASLEGGTPPDAV